MRSQARLQQCRCALLLRDLGDAVKHALVDLLVALRHEPGLDHVQRCGEQASHSSSQGACRGTAAVSQCPAPQ